MIKKCIRDIIEPIGFVNEGDKEEERWVSQFLCNLTGNVLTVVLVEASDEYGVPQILFNICDEDGTLVNTMTLDQLIVSFEEELEPVPTKSNKVYIPIYNVRIEVPVDMSEVEQRTFNDYIRDGYWSEQEIAEKCALEKLSKFFSCSDFNIVDYECDYILAQEANPATPDKFAKFIKEELGFAEGGHEELAKIVKGMLDEITINKLYDGTFRLLSLDNFEAEYGEDSHLLIRILKPDGYFPIALYHNPYRP